MSGYSEGGAGNKQNEFKLWHPQSQSAQSDIDLNLRELRNRSADLAMNSALGSAAINTSARSVIGAGLKVFPRLNPQLLNIKPEFARAWSRKVAAEFEIWSKNCDFLRRNTFGELQYVAYTSYLTYGDCFCLFRRARATRENPYTLRLQILEGNRVSNPQVGDYSPVIRLGKNLCVNGIEVDSMGVAQAYWISNRVPNENTVNVEPVSWVRVKARGRDDTPNVLHIAHDVRGNQIRGVPYLAPVILPLRQLSKFVNSELTSEIIKSYFSLFFIGTPTGTRDLNQIIPNTYEGDREPVLDATDYKLGPGTIGALPPGVDIRTVQSQSSGNTFATFIENLSRQIGAALGIPAEVLLKSFNSSYSASRAAMIQFFEEVKARREWFINDFCKPIYELFLDEAIANQRIIAPGYFDDVSIRNLWREVKFYGPTMAVLDPVKEVNAAEKRLKLGLTTYEQEAMELSGNIFEDSLAVLKEELRRFS